ncbi:MAG: hypothetical protein ACREBS_06550 [Nitrososphaerales archaeon]
MMSADYTQTLKSIKEAEEASSRQIAEKTKALSEELQRLQEEGEASISTGKAEAETYVVKEVEKTRSAAQIEADKLLALAQKDSQRIASKKIDQAEIVKIIQEVIFSEFSKEP